MRIEKTRSGQSAGSVKRSGASGDRAAFSSALEPAAPAVSTQSAAGLVGVSSVAAVMALQGAEDPLEKRKRVARRGRQMLESLDQLKLDLLDGRDTEATLTRMKTLIESAREQSDEPSLESLIDQIELRVEVEIAKRKSVHGN